MITDKKIVVIGSGISGIGAVKLLEAVGAKPTLYDSNEKLTESEVRSRLPQGSQCRVILGAFPEKEKKETELAILSPGVPVDLPLVEELKKQGTVIWGELELAYHFGKGKIAAITGTNGKTTTTTLVGEILKSAYQEVFVVGNIGTAYTQEALNMTDSSVTAAEVSSFQLETIENFHPEVSAILNITPDHLNRHHTMECYIRTKERIAENQTGEDTCVLNYDDQETRRFGEECKAKVCYFSRKEALEQGIYLDGTTIIWRDGEKKEEVCDVRDLKILGTHNYENVMAAVGITLAMGVSLDKIRETVLHFTAVEHRIEFVAEKKGVAYYNDSKGTNTDASIKAVEAMNRPTLVIGGGYDKHVTFDDWIDSFGEKVKWLVLLGQTAEQIAETARRHGFTNIIFVQDLKEAVDVCAEKAQSGDAVLLSPACASWGMFDNYEQRGRLFKEYVHALSEA